MAYEKPIPITRLSLDYQMLYAGTPYELRVYVNPFAGKIITTAASEESTRPSEVRLGDQIRINLEKI
jgi:hypothetical protein